MSCLMFECSTNVYFPNKRLTFKPVLNKHTYLDYRLPLFSDSGVPQFSNPTVPVPLPVLGILLPAEFWMWKYSSKDWSTTDYFDYLRITCDVQITHSPITLGNLSFINFVSLPFSLSLYGHPSIRLVSHYTDTHLTLSRYSLYLSFYHL